MMRKVAPTGIAAAEIGGITIHSFLEEQCNSRTHAYQPGDSKLEKEWRMVEYLLIDEMSMVGLHLLQNLTESLARQNTSILKFHSAV